MMLRILILLSCFMVLTAPVCAQGETEDIPDVPRLEIPEDDSTAAEGSEAIIPEEDVFETEQDRLSADDAQNASEISAEQAAENVILERNDLLSQLPIELQKEILEEAQYVHDRCERNSLYATLFECRCLAVKFIDARIAQGPDEDALALAEKQGSECINKPGIAGYGWKQCQELTYNMPYGRDEYCTCFANKYVEEYMKSPQAISPVLKRAMTNALSACDDGNGPVKGRW